MGLGSKMSEGSNGLEKLKSQLCGSHMLQDDGGVGAAAKKKIKSGADPIISIEKEQVYYDKEKAKLDKLYRKALINAYDGQKELKLYETDYKNYSIMGDPTSEKPDVENKIQILYKSLEERYNETSQDILSRATTQHQNYMKDLYAYINYYVSQEAYTKRMNNLLLMKQEETKTLEDQLTKMISGSATTNRKAVYEEHDLGNIKNSRKIMYYVYYLLFIFYIVFGRFFSAKEYRNYWVWVGIILYVTLPFYIKFITDGLVYMYREFLYIKDNKLSKNVYLDI